MIPSVQERKKNTHIFMNSYPYLCRLQNTIPNPKIKVDSSNKTLDFIGDKLKFDDWKPVLEAISNDRSLHLISIRSRNSKAKVMAETETESQVRQLNTPKSAALFTQFMISRITESVSKCLSNSPTLTTLVLEKIPLDMNALTHLTQGLENCQHLQQLSLPYSQLGDDGCAGLCHVLRHRLSLVWLNLTSCNLTDKGVHMLCTLLKFQKLNRYGESWKQSLRYRPVNPNNMPGLRRLTLNHNAIGDEGVKIFVETLVDDLWLKALDLQHCGITMVGAEALLNLVKDNEFLSVVDIRGNSQVPKSFVGAVVQQLADNNRESTPEWLSVDSPKSTSGSNSSSSGSRSTRFLSNTTLASKGLSAAVLPNKVKLPTTLPSGEHVRARSCSAKRVTSNNTPRPPWNCNRSNSNLRRGNSDQLIRTDVTTNKAILTELQTVKEQLQNVSVRLEEEKDRRIKIEQELEKYKQFIDFSDSSLPANKAALQNMFNQFCNSYLNGGSTCLQANDQHLQSQEASKDNIDSVIKIVNGENQIGIELNSKSEPEETRNSEENTTTSRVQYLFQKLLSG